MQAPNEADWLGATLKPLASTFAEVIVLTLFVNLLALATPIFVLQVYDRVIFHAGLSTLHGLALGMAAVVCFDFAMRQSRARILQTVALRIDVGVGQRLFDKITALPLRELERQPQAHWQQLFRDVDLMRNALSGASALLLCDLPFALAFLGFTVLIAPPVAWVLLIALPLFVLLAWRAGSAIDAGTRSERESAAARDRLIAELLGGRATVKALALERAIREAWADRHAASVERAIHRGSRADGYANLGLALSLVTTVAMTGFGAVAIIGQDMTVGALIAANMLSGRLVAPFNQLIATWRTYAGLGQAIRRLGRTFAQAEERRTGAIAHPTPGGHLVVEQVTFAYGDDRPPVIDGLSLTLAAGRLHAIIGANGGGKTTLLKLLQGLYRPNRGRVLLDGADLSQFGRHELARWIGYVPQECVLFSGSLRFNIGLRLPDEDDGAIIRAAEAAGAHPFILDLPEGYGTDAGELGHRLSAGQRQRIAIARALVGDPAVLLFDEPSSHLDRQAEADLRRLLLDAAATRTVVMVTHSPVLLAASQTLTVLERGRIAFHGPPGDVRFEGTRAVEPAGGDRAASPAEPQDLPPPQIAARTAARSTR